MAQWFVPPIVVPAVLALAVAVMCGRIVAGF
jgi:hypothetical protein